MTRSHAGWVALVLLVATPSLQVRAAGDPQSAWWDRLQALCGQAFAGELIRAPAGDDTFRNQPVVMHVRSCTPTQVRIPLVVGQDRSRTWVLSRDTAGITLRHDHRREDGQPDAVTRYGGVTSNAGSADAQLFPADDLTAQVIPGSGQRSVWLMEIQDGRFVYAANRVGTDRGFQVDFDLTQPVAPPPAPWGWAGD